MTSPKRRIGAAARTKEAPPPEPVPAWTFLTNHAHVLICLATDPEILMREIADRVGITERAVHRIVAELEQGGYIKRERDGRRNRYEINGALPLRHRIEEHRSVGDLLRLGEKKPARR